MDRPAFFVAVSEKKLFVGVFFEPKNDVLQGSAARMMRKIMLAYLSTFCFISC
jgi:hypothetical protein